jgi:hypothetical protein
MRFGPVFSCPDPHKKFCICSESIVIENTLSSISESMVIDVYLAKTGTSTFILSSC